MFPYGQGFAATHHVYDGETWTGPTDFYGSDYLAPPAPDESKSWGPIYLWANPGEYAELTMMLSLAPDPDYKPPATRQYTLTLDFVPDGMVGAPPVGTTWNVPLNKTLTVEVPTYRSYDGLTGYQFTLTAGPAPEPASLAGLLVAALLIRRRG